MNKQQTTEAGHRATGGVQFFVRMIGGAGRRTVTIRGMDPSDTIASIHGRIEAVTGIPRDQLRLIYRGRQLDLEKSLAECSITRDATLETTSRLRSFRHPQAWQWADSIVSGCLTLCRDGRFSPKTLIDCVSLFFTKLPVKKQEEQGVVEEEDIRFSAFLSLSAPTALVMLYLSPLRANKETADDCIRAFIQSVKGFKLGALCLPYYYKFAPILLEFCRLLRPHVANDDPMYDCLRSCFGSIVKSIEFDPFKLHEIGIGVHDVCPFVSELAAKLSNALGSMAESTPSSTMSSGPAESHACDFSAFMRHCGLIFINVGTGPFVDGVKFLLSTFYDLMGKVDLCLERLEVHLVTSEKGKGKEKAEPHCLAWGRFLTFLRELNGMSKVFNSGAAEDFFWVKIKERKAALNYIVVWFAKRDENNEWISQRKEVLDFAARRHLALLLLPEMKDEYGYEMLIDRSHLLAESFEYIANIDASVLLNRLFIKFKDEEATGPGVLREWFLLVCQEIFNPQNALFVACPNDRKRFFPNSASKVNPMHLDYFKFAGRVIAFALIHKIQVGVLFDRAFTLQLAGKGVSLEDIQDADPYLYSSCKQILAMDPDIVDQDALCLTFVWETEELGSRKVVELCSDGHNIAVNSRNRKNYVDRVIEHRFVTLVSDQINKFKDGFASVVQYPEMISFFRTLDPEELNWTLHGSEGDISVEDWKAHTEYNGYKKSDRQIVWFWKAVGEMSNEQKKVLLFFWTSIKHLPVEGFGGLASSLYIYKTREPQNCLPSSRTCFFRLCFPAYTSMAKMKARLSVITQEHVGCSFGAR